MFMADFISTEKAKNVMLIVAACDVDLAIWIVKTQIQLRFASQ